eukprot:9368849-Karenia_brevis.AAC.1
MKRVLKLEVVGAAGLAHFVREPLHMLRFGSICNPPSHLAILSGGPAFSAFAEYHFEDLGSWNVHTIMSKIP